MAVRQALKKREEETNSEEYIWNKDVQYEQRIKDIYCKIMMIVVAKSHGGNSRRLSSKRKSMWAAAM